MKERTHVQKKRGKTMETEADNLNDGDPQPMGPPEKFHHAPNTV
jgi:hypothetical protein